MSREPASVLCRVNRRAAFDLANIIHRARIFNHSPETLLNHLHIDPSSLGVLAKERRIKFYARLVEIAERKLRPFIRAQSLHLRVNLFASSTKPLSTRHFSHLRR